ncbi:recombinase RecF [Serratia plymuthica]|uniref:Recombinase RecF n=1 Tax=Serratia plymuthica TaxID=82996 RepID=A0A318P5R9_SERPL|nr:recombinase RecF [Serratia plymuthica]
MVAGHLRAASARQPERTQSTRGLRALPNRKGASKIAR